MSQEKVVKTSTKEVSCSGDEFSKHPLIYLKIKENKTEIVCPYCSRTFLYVEENKKQNA